MSDPWRLAFLIRSFEERLLALFSRGRLQGTVHTCSGQEWSALAIAGALRTGDRLLSNHRGHGHFLARRPDLLRPLLAEIMGLAEGLCGGIGGSQHLYAEGFYSNGVQGGMAPVAAGLALAGKIRGDGKLTALCVGDGTTGEGTLYEALNLAGIWRLPLLVVLERNGYAQSTPTGGTIAGDVARRAEGFGFACFRGDVWRPEELAATAREAADRARSGGGPAWLEIDCYRLNAHSKGDDFRPPEEISRYREIDPLAVFRRDNPDLASAYAKEAENAVDRALAAISPAPCRYRPEINLVPGEVAWSPVPETPAPRVRQGELVYRALRDFLARFPRGLLLGEDIAPPYGGAFRITRDLGELFPGRVWGTPISEAGITGLGTGLALDGFNPVVEIMFGDFLTLILDQIQQHAAKFNAMSGGRLKVPLIVRSPSGGRRGYGPTHSQSLEKHFLGISGLSVLALNARSDPGDLYRRLGEENGPSLVIENKTLYSRPVPPETPRGWRVWRSDEPFPTIRLSPDGTGPDITVVCYGGMLDQAEAALEDAFRHHEIIAEIICPTRLHPLNPVPIFASLKRTGRLLTVEEGPGFAGWGAEVASQALYAGIEIRKAKRLAYDGLIPASAKREAELLPSGRDIVAALRGLMAG
ncbi:MAG: pyruvate dehydrogenase [Planctomycetota bacterium]|jgi:2-oxoisovalerate dehydrogenase E1 component|nr:pyruvate dehydrogenase [Planctomycetota bacterium]